MLNEFKPSRKLLSSYYIAAILSFFLFQLTRELVTMWAVWLTSALSGMFNLRINSNGVLWLIFFLVCFTITFAIRRAVVEPLGFYIEEEGAPTWELIVLTLLVLGFYIYLLNQVFSQPMPSDWFGSSGPMITRLLGGFENTYTVRNTLTLEQRNAWSIIPWVWYVGPIAFMYIRTKVKVNVKD